MKFVVDSHAWISYFEGGSAGKKVKGYVEDSKNEIVTNILNLAEISSFFDRKGFDDDEAHKVILSLSKIFRFDVDFSREAGKLHAQIRKKIKDFGMADAFVLLTARKINAKIITGYPHFKGFKEAFYIE